MSRSPGIPETLRRFERRRWLLYGRCGRAGAGTSSVSLEGADPDIMVTGGLITRAYKIPSNLFDTSITKSYDPFNDKLHDSKLFESKQRH
ncbi:hypothetical protein TSAR_012457 [Trichomalopsis sarcophagae]|uniref:Uncharacterized protein n=1 Tax=Trichomalopsis sarcophagae TaxID=543379 RepID=A0A232FGA1_9HYME|nr:hypothetical protein TSAR_012457 [Trichomalopsis sarcophagae]